MNDECRTLRLTLDENRELRLEEKAHLASCASCQEHAWLLSELKALEPSQADEARCQEIMEALPVARWQLRRVSTWVPLIAGVGLAGAGLALLGGPPAPSAVATLPSAASGVVPWVGSWVLDMLSAAQGGSDAARALMAAGGAWLLAWLTFTALGGTWALKALVRRGRS